MGGGSRGRGGGRDEGADGGRRRFIEKGARFEGFWRNGSRGEEGGFEGSGDGEGGHGEQGRE